MLEVCNLKKTFGDNEVLKDVNFKLENGEIVCLLGKNGSGKSTLINCILRMLQQDSGHILFDNIEISDYNSKKYFSEVSALLESSANVYSYLTAMQNIEYFSGLLNIDVNYEYVNFLLNKFSIYEFKNKKVGTYSLGMRQKLAIIISLLSEPKLLLLDEPTLGLDIESKVSIIKILKDLAIQKKISILLTTHQIDVVEKINGRVILLKDGMIEDFSLHEYEKKFMIKYKEGSKIVSKQVSGNIINTLYSIKLENIIEINRAEIDLEEILMEKLNESNKSGI
ncbi:ABC transporter ATP-binding protein [Anaerococcus sp. AGMB09787]|uniref:ABC transporter ATP-binding protein n=1 Tax=Anaerococcus sp. AGMB09787 TaxID=2922869 RepID=UPI001FAE9BE1|nr:ABC transporter ATP-binding protein [Anaerococcus sp. AGMB09787]